MNKLDKFTLFIHHPGPGDKNRTMVVLIDEKRLTASPVDQVEGAPPEIDRPVYGYEWSITRDLAGQLSSASNTIGELKYELAQCEKARAQDQQRLLHLEAYVEEQWAKGEDAVLAFIKNGRFLHELSPAYQFVLEVEAGWRSWGKAEADKARWREVNEAVDKVIHQP